jgi:glycosyltransferase involved in cell wall biosynthesis
MPRNDTSHEIDIVWFAPTETGGHPAYVGEILRQLSEPNVRVTWLAGRHLLPMPMPAGVTVRRVLPSLFRGGDWRPHSPLMRIFRLILRDLMGALLVAMRHRGCVLHLQEMPTPVWFFTIPLLKRWACKQVVVTVHNIDSPGRSLLSRLRTYSTRKIVDHVNVVVVHAEANRSRLLDDSCSATVVVVPHFAWTYQSSLKSSTTDASRDDDGIHWENEAQCDPKALSILFFGHVLPHKGVDLLLEAVAVLGPPVRVRIAGSCSAAEEIRLRQLAADIGSEALIDFDLRFIPDIEVPALFQAADCVALPYRQFEAQSGVLHLAIAHGLPQVVSTAGGLAEVVSAYNTGRVCVAIPEALAEAFHEMRSSARRAEYRSGCERAAADLSPKSHWTALLELYDAE